MKEKHQYTSALEYGSMRFNLDNLRVELINHFNKNSTRVFHYLAEDAPHFLYGYHSEGISVHIQEDRGTQATGPRFIDITLVSEVRPTLSLEEKIKELAEKHKKSS